MLLKRSNPHHLLMMEEQMAANSKNTISLLSEQAMGGIVGGAGYKYQDHYVVGCIPNWLKDSDFSQFLIEGIGDVDVHFIRNGLDKRISVQVKDHSVDLPEFRQVLRKFYEIAVGSPDTYESFTLACPGTTKAVKQLLRAIERHNGARPFYNQTGQLNLSTRADLEKLAQRLDLGVPLDFLLDNVNFETGLPGVEQISDRVKIFTAGV